MQVEYEKIAILDECMVDYCWTVACDQHLDGPIHYVIDTQADTARQREPCMLCSLGCSGAAKRMMKVTQNRKRYKAINCHQQ